jgi:hypothetical protein
MRTTPLPKLGGCLKRSPSSNSTVPSSYTKRPVCNPDLISTQTVALTTSLCFILPSQICLGRKYLILPVVLRRHHVIITVLLHVKEFYIFWGGRMEQVRRNLLSGLLFTHRAVHARQWKRFQTNAYTVACVASRTIRSIGRLLFIQSSKYDMDKPFTSCQWGLAQSKIFLWFCLVGGKDFCIWWRV